MLKYALLALAATGFALLLTPQVQALAIRIGAVDKPGGRKVHENRVPRLGGLAVLAALLGALAAGVVVDRTLFDVFLGYGWSWGWVFAGALVVVATGVVDDIRSLGALPKLGFQLLAGVMVMVGTDAISAISDPFTGGSIELGWLGLPLTLLWVVGITNAFNLIDGLDGLAAGVALIASGTLFLVSLAAGRVDVALLAMALTGSLAGFIYYNFNPASIFLGDSGSLLLGYLLAVLSIESAHKGETAVVILVPMLALGLPIMDTLLSLLRRTLRAFRVVRVDHERNQYRFFVVGSVSIFQADSDHIHHRLRALGLTHRRAVLLLYSVCLLLGAMAFFAVTAKGANTVLLVAIVGTSTFIGIRKLGYQEVEVLKRGALLPLFDLPVVNRRMFHALVDAGFIAAAYSLSLVVAYAGRLEPATRDYLLGTLVVVVAAKLAAFVYSGMYQRAYRYSNAADLTELVKSLVAAQIVTTAVLLLFYGLPAHAATVFLLDFYLSATLVVGTRVSFKVLEVIARGHGDVTGQPVLIYGAGNGGTALLREISQNPTLGYRVVGFVDDLRTMWGRQVNGVPVLGSGTHLGDFIRRSGAREVVISSSKISPECVQAAAAACGAVGIHLRRFRFMLEEVRAVRESESASTVRRLSQHPAGVNQRIA